MPNLAPTSAQVAPLFAQAMLGLSQFNESYFVSDSESVLSRRFGDYLARRLRYAVFWSFYEQNVYRRVHNWSSLLKADYGLYSYTRSIYSPAYRLGEFWATHLIGGQLDPDAGDGKVKASALPIVTDNEALRPAIAQIWRDSNWQSTKETWTRFGSVLGDVGLMVVDDPARQKVYLKVIHPRSIFHVNKDPFGNVKGYTLVDWRVDPESSDFVGIPILATYTEVATKVGQKVLYQTYRNGFPYDWRDYPYEDSPKLGPQWTEDIGFVPMVVTQHRDMGLGWGWSELHPSISKLNELDDLASKLDDWVRKTVDAPWFFTGVAPAIANPDGSATGNNQLVVSVPDASDQEPEPGRNNTPTLYANDANAKAQPLVAPLSVAEVSAHALSILKELERDHPELQTDMATASGDASGRALRVARERVEAMVAQRRAGYDDGLVRAQMMAISIGAAKGYPGFEAFDAGSFERGDLAHTIGDRPVFAIDEMDRLEELKARAEVIKTLVAAGLPLESALEHAGLKADAIAKVVAAKAADQAQKAQRAAQMAQMGLPGDVAAGGAPGVADAQASGYAVGGNGATTIAGRG